MTTATQHRVPRGVERYGVEPIPAELRTVGWRDLFAMMLAFAEIGGGLNAAALAAVAAAIVVYYLVPHSWVKAAWGFGIALVAYLVLARLQADAFPRTRAGLEPAESDAREPATHDPELRLGDAR